MMLHISFHLLICCIAMAVKATLRGERLIIMSGTAHMEWHQTLGFQVVDVFDNIPLIPLQSLPQARTPQLSCHQPPVNCGYVWHESVHHVTIEASGVRTYKGLKVK